MCINNDDSIICLSYSLTSQSLLSPSSSSNSSLEILNPYSTKDSLFVNSSSSSSSDSEFKSRFSHVLTGTSLHDALYVPCGNEVHNSIKISKKEINPISVPPKFEDFLESKCDVKSLTQNEGKIQILSLPSKRDVMSSLMNIQCKNVSEHSQNLTEMEHDDVKKSENKYDINKKTEDRGDVSVEIKKSPFINTTKISEIKNIAENVQFREISSTTNAVQTKNTLLEIDPYSVLISETPIAARIADAHSVTRINDQTIGINNKDFHLHNKSVGIVSPSTDHKDVKYAEIEIVIVRDVDEVVTVKNQFMSNENSNGIDIDNNSKSSLRLSRVLKFLLSDCNLSQPDLLTCYFSSSSSSSSSSASSFSSHSTSASLSASPPLFSGFVAVASSQSNKILILTVQVPHILNGTVTHTPQIQAEYQLPKNQVNR